MICLMKRRWYIVAVIFVLLGILGGRVYDDRTVVRSESDTASVYVHEPKIDRYEEIRMKRDNNRSLARELLQDAIKEEMNEEMRHERKQELRELDAQCRAEAEIELILKARGYQDALVFCQKENICVMLKKTSIDREEVMEIAPLIARIGKVEEEHILIRTEL